MKQLVHAPTFLLRYQKWWLLADNLLVTDIEFAVLILRICSYTLQFLPSQLHPSDSIGGLSLQDIQSACTGTANRLAKACVALDWKGCLIRVQHLLFVAVTSSCEGRTDHFWEAIGTASQAAQKAGIQRETIDSGNSHSDFEKEMRRRVFCCLYILDR